jgi:hypothetical protein
MDGNANFAFPIVIAASYFAMPVARTRRTFAAIVRSA